MSVTRLINFLELNVSNEDREFFDKVKNHITKDNARNLNLLITKYNIDKSKFLIAPADALNNDYVARLDELLVCCENILVNKINISKFSASKYILSDMVDISSTEKVKAILKDLKQYNKTYNDIIVSVELLKSPLNILIASTGTKIQSGTLEEHAYEYLNNHRMIKDQIVEVDEQYSIVGEYRKDLLKNKNKRSAKLQPKLVKAAVLDYFDKTGEMYYLESDFEHDVSRQYADFIEKKTSSSTKTATLYYTIVERWCPILSLIIMLSLLLLLPLGAEPYFINICMGIMFGITIIQLGIFLYRLITLIKNSTEVYAIYYEKYPRFKKIYASIFIVIMLINVIYTILFNDTLISFWVNFDKIVEGLEDNLLIKILLSIGIGGIFSLIIFGFYKVMNKHHENCILFIALTIIFLLLLMRANFLNLGVFSDVSIGYILFASALLLHLISVSKQKRVLAIALFVLLATDLLLVYFLDDIDYLNFIK